VAAIGVAGERLANFEEDAEARTASRSS